MTELTMKESKNITKTLSLEYIEMSLSIAIKRYFLFVNTKLYPYMPAGTTPSNLYPTFIG